MKTVFLTLALSVMCFSFGFADQETLVPDATDSPDQWVASSGDKVVAVTDGVDGVYILETASGEDQMFTLTNTTFSASATVDSFRIRWRGQDEGSGNNRIQVIAFTDTDLNCKGSNQSVTTSWVDYDAPFIGAPDADQDCIGVALTKSIMDALRVRVDCSALGSGREVRVTDIDVIVFYTPDAGGGGSRVTIIHADDD